MFFNYNIYIYIKFFYFIKYKQFYNNYKDLTFIRLIQEKNFKSKIAKLTKLIKYTELFKLSNNIIFNIKLFTKYYKNLILLVYYIILYNMKIFFIGEENKYIFFLNWIQNLNIAIFKKSSIKYYLYIHQKYSIIFYFFFEKNNNIMLINKLASNNIPTMYNCSYIFKFYFLKLFYLIVKTTLHYNIRLYYYYKIFLLLKI